MQDARAGNGHFRHRVAGHAFQETEIFQHRVMAKSQFTGDRDAPGFGLHALKLNAVVGLVPFHPVQSYKEIPMPSGAAELPVRNDLQPQRAQLRDDACNLVVFHGAQLCGIYLAIGETLAGLLYRGGT